MRRAIRAGGDRVRERDRGKAIAGKSTLNRLELTQQGANENSRYKKIVAQQDQIDDVMVDVCMGASTKRQRRWFLDVDATDDPLYGRQEGRFFHGYYREYCYLPLYLFWGEYLLCARLRVASEDPASGVIQELERIVKKLRQRWPAVRIIVRGGLGFLPRRDHELVRTQPEPGLRFWLGENERLNKEIEGATAQAQADSPEHGRGGAGVQTFVIERGRVGRERRVVGKAEYLEKGANPRFVVTSLPPSQKRRAALYEQLYCARGEMENRIKEQQLALFADRTSTGWMRSNQIRLYFSSIAYCLLAALRRLGLRATELAQAQCQTIRLRLLKIGAQIRVTARKVWVSFSESYPYLGLFQRVFARLQQIPSGG